MVYGRYTIPGLTGRSQIIIRTFIISREIILQNAIGKE